jgi:beta-exotoxin I transport system ATP-binding protein
MKNTENGPQNSELAIDVRGLRKSYGNVQALRGIDLEVQRGEIFGFLGPNGAGKTTTIRCLLDMIRPNAGSIHLFGINPQEDPVAAQALAGYLPGEVHYYENMISGRQIRFYADMRNGSTDWKYVQELGERLSLDMKVPIKNLSKGNKQKIGVIQALMHRPKLLLLDEPTSGLDPLMQQEVLALLREANSAGATIFFSSHIMSEVENLAQRVAIIRSGEIAEVAKTSSLTGQSLRRLTVRLKRPVSHLSIDHLPGVEVIESIDNTSFTLQVTGDMEQLVKTLGDYPVLDLETDHPSLEETFLAYYTKNNRVKEIENK